MHPILFRVFGFAVPSYGAFFLAAILLAVFLGRVQARALGIDPNKATDFAFTTIIAGFFSAKLLYVLVLIGQEGWGGFDLWPALQGGGIWYGGIAGGLAGGAVYARLNRTSMCSLADATIPGAILGHALGRIGCLLAGCCYGRPTEASFGIVFTDPVCQVQKDLLGVPLHPVQLYEAGIEGLTGFFLVWLSRHRSFIGQIAPVYLVIYAPVRFVLETFRSDFRGKWFGGTLSTSQVLAVASAFVGAGVYAYLRRGVAAGAASSVRRAGGRRKDGAASGAQPRGGLSRGRSR